MQVPLKNFLSKSLPLYAFLTSFVCTAVAQNKSKEIAVEPIIYNRDIWLNSPNKLTKSHPYIDWDRSADNINSDNKNLTLWGQAIEKIRIEGGRQSTNSINFVVYDSDLLNSQESSKITKAWSSLISNKSNKSARSQSPIRLKSGAHQTRTVWNADDCTVLLSNTKHEDSQTITISFLQSDHAKKVLSISDPDVVSYRTFYSSDFSKSFVGKLNAYDEENKAAKIDIKRGVSSIQMDTLSDSDQTYIKRMGPYVAIYRGLAISFKEVKNKAKKKGSLSITDFNYDITVRNNASTQMDNVKVDYYIYYYLGDVKKAGSILKRTKGNKTIKIYPKMTDYLSTDKLELVKNIVKGRSGG